jgi:hypothetical protein
MSTCSHAPIRLASDRLAVEIAPPGTAYARTRFDWTAFIAQVTLDQRHTFCVPEDPDPDKGTGGIGLCNEFGIDQPIGYDDARPGECFPKLGIGVLERAEKSPYTFMHPYKVVERFPIQIETTANSARFVVEPVECRGYAARLTKTVTVESATLQVAYELENVGQKPITTNEYCHNFCGIDGHLMGPDYSLRLPYPIHFEPLPQALAGHTPSEILVVQEHALRLRETPQHPFYRRLAGFAQTGQPQWELVHTPSGVRMREIDDFAPCRVALWGTTHVISTEVFKALDVQPGETETWTRRWEFYA